MINAIRKEEADQDALKGLDYPHTCGWRKKSRASPTSRERRARIPGTGSEIPLMPEVEMYPLEEANQALVELKTKIRGAKVIEIG